MVGPHTFVARVTATAEGSGLRRVLRGGALGAAGAGIGTVLNLALIVTVTRAFSQEEAGLLFSATSVFLITAAVANAGAPDGLVYFTARLRVLGRREGVRELLRTAVGPAVLGACAASAVLVVCAEPVAGAMGTGEAASYLRLLAAFLPAAVLAETALAAGRAHHDMAGTVAVERVGRPLAQLALVGAVAATGSAGLLAVAWAGPYLPAAAVAWFWLGRILRRTAPADEAPRAGAAVSRAEFWSFALPRAAAGCAQLGVQRGGVVLTALLGGLAGAALFTAATRITVAGQTAAQAVLHAAQPRFAEQVAAGDHAGARNLYRAVAAWLVCLNWPLYLTVLVFSGEVMGLFGPAYASGAAALAVVCAGQMAATALGPGDLVLSMTGRTGMNLLNNVLALAANVLLCVLFVPPLGAVGAAAALAGAVLVRKLLPLWQLRSTSAPHPLCPSVLAAAGSALLWCGALPLLTRALSGGGVLLPVAAVAAGAAGHLATVWAMRGLLRLRR